MSTRQHAVPVSPVPASLGARAARQPVVRILLATLAMALPVAAVLFALAHFPNDGVSALGLVITVAAGAMFGAAYLKTGRIWLAAGLHFAWNFITGTVFSLPVSGAAAKGWIIGRLSGPEWLSGGDYGIEASAVTLLAVVAVTATLGLRLRDAGGLRGHAATQPRMAP